MIISPILYYKLKITFLLFILLISLLIILDILYHIRIRLNIMSINLYQYKITNFYFTFSCISLYTLLFVLLIYGLRLIYLYKTIDLKILYKTLCDTLNIFMQVNIMLQIYCIIIILLLLLIIIFTFVNIQTFCYSQFLKFHIFFYDTTIFERTTKPSFYKTIYKKFIVIIEQCNHDTDIITTYIIHLAWLISHKTKKIKIYTVILHILRSRLYRLLFYISPLFVILYDCKYHNWVLIHIFSFMLVYTPLIILKRIGDGAGCLCEYSLEFFRNLYYYDKKYIIAIPKVLKIPMIDNYLLTRLKNNLELIRNGLQENNYIYILLNSNFLPDEYNKDMFINLEGLTIVKVLDKFYCLKYEYEEGKYDLGEEWIIIENKYII